MESQWHVLLSATSNRYLSVWRKCVDEIKLTKVRSAIQQPVLFIVQNGSSCEVIECRKITKGLLEIFPSLERGFMQKWRMLISIDE